MSRYTITIAVRDFTSLMQTAGQVAALVDAAMKGAPDVDHAEALRAAWGLQTALLRRMSVMAGAVKVHTTPT